MKRYILPSRIAFLYLHIRHRAVKMVVKIIKYTIRRFREQGNFNRGNKGTWYVILGNRGTPSKCFWGTRLFFEREHGNIAKKTRGTEEHISPYKALMFPCAVQP